jgi:hypothetical protein
MLKYAYMGLKFGSTFGHLQVGLASRVGLRVSWTKPITANAKRAVANLLAKSFAQNSQFALAA